MARGRKCKKFNWRWTDSVFIHVHQNNLRVFRKIDRMRKTKIGRSVDKIIDGLFVDEVWGGTDAREEAKLLESGLLPMGSPTLILVAQSNRNFIRLRPLFRGSDEQ